MSITLINIGAAPNDGTGDVLRDAFDISNDNDVILDKKYIAARSDILGLDLSDSSLNHILTSGYDAPGDRGQLHMHEVATEPEHPLKNMSADGKWFEGVPKGAVSAADFGFLPLNSDTDNADALADWSEYLNRSENQAGFIPPGLYNTSGGAVFDRSNTSIFAHGATIVYTATDGQLFDFNSGALPDESVIISNMRFYGGRFICSMPGNAGANDATCFRFRGTTRCMVEDVFCQDWGSSMIEAAPRETLHINRCHGFQNNIHVWVPAFVDAPRGNPQDIHISNCGLSIYYDVGLKVDGGATHLTFEKSFCIPAAGANEAVVIETSSGAGGVFNRDIEIRDIDFEQGTAGVPYIKFQDSHGIRGRAFSVTDCSFADSATKTVEAENVDGLTISGNYIASTQDGWLTLDANCKGIDVGQNTFPGQAQNNLPAITYACARDEIAVWPYEIYFLNDEGLLQGHQFGSFSTGEELLDMSVRLGGNFFGMIDPIGYTMNGMIRDSGSAGAALGVFPAMQAGMVIVPDSSVTSFDEMQHIRIDLAGDLNNRERHFSSYVRATDGDLYRRFFATGAGTLDVYLKVGVMHLGRGKILG